MDDRNPALFNLHHTSFLVSPIRVNGVDVCYCYQQVGLTKWTQNIGCNVQLFFFMSTFYMLQCKTLFNPTSSAILQPLSCHLNVLQHDNMISINTNHPY